MARLSSNERAPVVIDYLGQNTRSTSNTGSGSLPLDALTQEIFTALSKGTSSQELLARLQAASDTALGTFLVNVGLIAGQMGQSDPGAKEAFDWLIGATKAILESRKPPSPADILTKEIFDSLSQGTTGEHILTRLNAATDQALQGFQTNVKRIAANMASASEGGNDPQAKEVLRGLVDTAKAIVESRKPKKLDVPVAPAANPVPRPTAETKSVAVPRRPVAPAQGTLSPPRPTTATTAKVKWLCPGCRKDLRAEKKLIGKRVKCRSCGKVHAVPGTIA